MNNNRQRTGARRQAVAFGLMVATSGFGVTSQAQEVTSEDLGAALNAALKEAGYPYRLASAKLYTREGEGRTLGFMDTGNKETGFRFVPRDPVRFWSGDQSDFDDNITWASEALFGDLGPGLAESQAAIERAMQTWDDIKFTELDLTRNPVPPTLDLGFTEWVIEVSVLGTNPAEAGGLPIPVADVTHAGYATAIDDFLFLVAPDIADQILAVTFFWTIGELLGADPELDIDGDGNIDMAFTEIYYTANFPWGIDTDFPIDIESVALHETGHGLGQDHFGSGFLKKKGAIQLAPGAVMNAGYVGMLQELSGTDLAGHVNLWGTWPLR